MNIVLGSLGMLVAALAMSLAVVVPAQAQIVLSEASVTLEQAGVPLTEVQAGSHPDVTTDFRVAPIENSESGNPMPNEQLNNIDVDLPPGFYGNPTATTTCPQNKLFGTFSLCPADSQVGYAEVRFGTEESFGLNGFIPTGIYNLEPEAGAVASFGFDLLFMPVILNTYVDSEGEYHLRTSSHTTNNGLPIFGARLTIWGVPADPVHDPQRWSAPFAGGAASGLPKVPLLTAPTRCGEEFVASLRANSWEDSAYSVESSPLPPVTGCDRLAFEPGIQVRPAVSDADTPTSYDVNLSVPQNTQPSLPETPVLRKAVVTMPEGVSVSPGSAQGLGACSDAQIALGTNKAPSCPDSSKIGSIVIETPVLPDPLKGHVILGTPKKGQLLRIFMAVRGSGVLVKIPGIVKPDPNTGQLTATFDETPQLPFEHLHLHFKGGSRAALVNPDTCGTKTVTSEMVPWGGPTANPSASFEITGCKDGFSPGLEAGAENPIAGASSPFTIRITREDGEQRLGSIDLSLPPGQLAKLRGIPYCPDATLAGISGDEGAAAAEAANMSCPAASQIGTVQVGAGAGSSPFYVGGKAYLAGPYKGAPLSIAFVTPALAGPFDLGNVVVRSALKVDPVTAQVEAVSDPLPTILHGVPLDLKDVRVNLDRPDFTLNPTSCEEMQVSGQVISSVGTAADVANRYQVGDCAFLGFKPKLSLRLSGATHRSAHPKLRAVLRARKGDANIGKAVVTLPKTEFLENAHIRTVCTRVQYAADNCPKGSVYGYAKAWSPLLDQPLQGPVYLRSSNHPLPDLVASLDGQIHVDLAGRIDSVHQRIRNTFWAVPDAPVSKFVLTMQGGKKGLLVNNTELCKAKPRASVQFTGHNGKRSSSNPLVKADCGKK